MIGRQAAHLLRRHVSDRSEDDAGPGLDPRREPGQRPVRRRAGATGKCGRRTLGPRQLRQAEIEDLDPAVARDEQVLRLQVAVDDPLLVSRRQPLGDLPGIVQRLAGGERAAGQPVAQRRPFEQLLDDVRRPLVRSGVEHGQDVRVVELPHGARLLLEAAQPLGIGHERGRQDLHRHVTRQAGVAGAIHLSHPAGADGAEDFVGTESGAGSQRHGARRISCLRPGDPGA
ncbi:MAG TPA: hypothetical protein VGV60_12470 [Candidatus Polarisedimenticolia bacterium]|nr:hypothetical protein [Candidatus Polarisedimenticolia bacterium]